MNRMKENTFDLFSNHSSLIKDEFQSEIKNETALSIIYINRWDCFCTWRCMIMWLYTVTSRHCVSDKITSYIVSSQWSLEWPKYLWQKAGYPIDLFLPDIYWKDLYAICVFILSITLVEFLWRNERLMNAFKSAWFCSSSIIILPILEYTRQLNCHKLSYRHRWKHTLNVHQRQSTQTVWALLTHKIWKSNQQTSKKTIKKL